MRRLSAFMPARSNAPNRLRPIEAGKDVLINSEFGKEIEFLRNNGDARQLAVPWADKVDALAVALKVPLGWLDPAGQTLHGCALARAVFARETDYVPRKYVEADPPAGEGRTVSLANALQCEERRFRRFRSARQICSSPAAPCCAVVPSKNSGVPAPAGDPVAFLN
jgi:hypothetical protein